MKVETVKAAIEYLMEQGMVSRDIWYYPDEIATVITFLENEEMVNVDKPEESKNNTNK